MISTEGLFFSGKETKYKKVQVILEKERLSIPELGLSFSQKEMTVHPASGKKAMRRIDFASGQFLLIPAQVKLPFSSYATSENLSFFIEKLEKHKYAILFSLLLAVGATLFLIYGAVPLLTTVVIHTVPKSFYQNISENMIKTLVEFDILRESQLDERKKRYFEKWVDSIGKFTGIKAKILFYDADFPNAFALPGEYVILLDDLVEMSTDPIGYQDIIGVLAHEFGHHYYHHPIENMVSQFLLDLLQISLGNQSQIDISLPATMMLLSFSRKKEKEADLFAIKVMKHLNISTQPLANLFRKIEKEYEIDNDSPYDKVFHLFSTHPSTSERIKRFEASETQEIEE